MRVQDPLKYGEVLLGLALPNEHYTADRLQKMFGGSEVNINFPQNIPVPLTYQTAFVDDASVEMRDDVYGRDASCSRSEGLRAQDGGQRHRPARRQFSSAAGGDAPGTFGAASTAASGRSCSSHGCSAAPGAGAPGRAPASAPRGGGVTPR
jgi:hypothetical protein